MRHVIELLFIPPPMPHIPLGLPAHLTEGVMSSISAAFKLVYFRGVYDGFIAGVLVSLLLAPHLRRARGGD